MSQIIQNLYLGDSYDAACITFLRSKKIVTIINCTNDIPFYFKTSRHPHKFNYIKYPINDDLTTYKKMLELLPEMVELIDQIYEKINLF